MIWICPICSTSNDDSAIRCFVCDFMIRRKRNLSEKEMRESYEKGMKMYNRGRYDQAFEGLYYAAEGGYLPAELAVAECFRLGRGAERDDGQAYEWYREAAETGDAGAQYTLGRFCHAGSDPANIGEAISWLEKSAGQDYVPAIRLLATIYLYGKGVPADYDKALELFDDMNWLYDPPDGAKCFDDPEALLGMAYCYSGKKRNFLAAHYYKKAAKAGLTEAQYVLAYRYETGKGLPRSRKKAAFWYKKASDHGVSKPGKGRLCLPGEDAS